MDIKKGFAKLFETEDRGQVLVKLDTDEDGNPEVRVYCIPHEDLGVSSVSINWKDDTEESWEKAEQTLESMTEESVMKVLKPLYDVVENYVDNED